jgi:FKBP-type peptidyl-prolyl cis-trans isomerase FkpA
VVFEGELFDDDAILVSDKAAIDHFLDSIQAPNVQKDTSGIRWVYSGTPGTGALATQFSNVNVTYKGTVFKTSTVFDQQTSPVSFPMSTLIEGWQTALQKIPSGSTFTLYVPSALAYGPVIQNYTGGSIPANSILVFDIHFISTN